MVLYEKDDHWAVSSVIYEVEEALMREYSAVKQAHRVRPFLDRLDDFPVSVWGRVGWKLVDGVAVLAVTKPKARWWQFRLAAQYRARSTE